MRRVRLLLIGAVGVLGVSGFFRASAPVRAESGAVIPVDADKLRDDPRFTAFILAYASLIDSVAYGEEDAVFFLGRRPIHFADGRMLREGREDEASDFAPVFYRYPLERLSGPPAITDEDDRRPSTDLLESLFGRTESGIRRHCRSTTFLGHRMFVNSLLIEPLRAAERDILAEAGGDSAVARWISELDITYSFIDKGIAGSSSRSYHAWGMAVDLVPASYGGKQVYWRWGRALGRDGWRNIPPEGRWSPPQAVIEAFERAGFVWGGKWLHFDTIHFEYRPEILLYNRLISGP